MRTSLAVQPHLYIGDSTGRPLDYGMVYFGQVDKDPEFYPIDIFYDEALTIAAAQPVRTKGGFLNAVGDMVEIYASERYYSVKVLDSHGVEVFYKPKMERTDFNVEDIKQSINDALGKFDKNGIFKQSGIKFLAGAEGVDHCGWGSYVEFASGKLTFIYRRAANHAILNNAEIWAKDSFDGGVTWSKDRLILQSTEHDLRPDPLKLMANNRAGTFINRATTTEDGYFPAYFMYSDDEGVTWQTNEIPSAKPYTFQSTGGMIEFPASVGGHDTQGFVAYGFLSADGLDALKTVNNGDTWVQVDEVAVNSGEVTGISEWAGCRLGNTDRWIFVTRSKIASGWNPKMIIWVTNNPLNWGTWKDSGLGLGGNPPQIVYDDINDDIVILTPSRGGRPVVGYPDNTLLEARIDATTAYAAGGMVGSLTKYKVIAAFPEWFTAYLAPAKIRGEWATALTCAEVNGVGAAQILVGNFISSTGEVSALTNKMATNNARLKLVDLIQETDLGFPFKITAKSDPTKYLQLRDNRLEMRGLSLFEINTNVPVVFSNKVVVGTVTPAVAVEFGARINASVDGESAPSMLSWTNSTALRRHILFNNGSGTVGSISTTGSAASYNTTSDYRVKTIMGDYQDALSVVNNINIYDAVFSRDADASPQPMVIAHELQTVCPYAVTGEKDAVSESGLPELQQVDHSKLIPVLIAAVQELSEQVNQLKAL